MFSKTRFTRNFIEIGDGQHFGTFPREKSGNSRGLNRPSLGTRGSSRCRVRHNRIVATRIRSGNSSRRGSRLPSLLRDRRCSKVTYLRDRPATYLHRWATMSVSSCLRMFRHHGTCDAREMRPSYGEYVDCLE